jgi:O-succinylbenzoate synthase
MHIESVQLSRVRLSGLTSCSGAPLESVVVALASGDQLGWGEATLGVGPSDSPEWSAGAFACLRDWLAPAIVGRPIGSGKELQQALQPFQGNARAKSALDIAWWNLAAQEQKKPLFEVLGGAAVAIPLETSVGVTESTDELLAEVGTALAAGYGTVALKFRPGWDIQMVKAVRESFPAEPIAIDCDGLCTLGQQEMFYRLEDFFLKYIEQPFGADDLVGHAMLQQAIRTPICLDESITSVERAEQAIDLGSCRRMRIDVARVGGLTPALAIREACEDAHLAWAVGGAPQGALVSLSTMALATLPNHAAAMALTRSSEPWLSWDNAGPLETLKAGKLTISLADVPGPGVAIDLCQLEEAAVDQATIC